MRSLTRHGRIEEVPNGESRKKKQSWFSRKVLPLIVAGGLAVSACATEGRILRLDPILVEGRYVNCTEEYNYKKYKAETEFVVLKNRHLLANFSAFPDQNYKIKINENDDAELALYKKRSHNVRDAIAKSKSEGTDSSLSHILYMVPQALGLGRADDLEFAIIKVLAGCIKPEEQFGDSIREFIRNADTSSLNFFVDTLAASKIILDMSGSNWACTKEMYNGKKLETSMPRFSEALFHNVISELLKRSEVYGDINTYASLVQFVEAYSRDWGTLLKRVHTDEFGISVSRTPAEQDALNTWTQTGGISFACANYPLHSKSAESYSKKCTGNNGEIPLVEGSVLAQMMKENSRDRLAKLAGQGLTFSAFVDKLNDFDLGQADDVLVAINMPITRGILLSMNPKYMAALTSKSDLSEMDWKALFKQTFKSETRKNLAKQFIIRTRIALSYSCSEDLSAYLRGLISAQDYNTATMIMARIARYPAIKIPKCEDLPPTHFIAMAYAHGNNGINGLRQFILKEFKKELGELSGLDMNYLLKNTDEEGIRDLIFYNVISMDSISEEKFFEIFKDAPLADKKELLIKWGNRRLSAEMTLAISMIQIPMEELDKLAYLIFDKIDEADLEQYVMSNNPAFRASLIIDLAESARTQDGKVIKSIANVIIKILRNESMKDRENFLWELDGKKDLRKFLSEVGKTQLYESLLYISPKYNKLLSHGKNIALAFEAFENLPYALVFLTPQQISNIGQTFDIEYFKRYPPSVLARLPFLANEDMSVEVPNQSSATASADSTAKRAIFVLNKNDTSGTFHLFYENFVALSHNGYDIYVFETQSVQSITDFLKQFRMRHGQADFLVFAGHGTPTEIDFGDHVIDEVPYFKSKLTAEYHQLLLDEIGKAEPVKKGGFIGLIACSTGKEKNGMGYAVANSIKRTTYAPNDDISIHVVSFKFDDKNNAVGMEFGKNTAEFKPEPEPLKK